MSSPSFSMNERVLCYHGPVIYEAKITGVEIWNETNTQTGAHGPHYKVHYKGWKSTWDEWVDETRVLQFNDANLAMQKGTIAEAHAQEKKAKAAANAGSSKAAGTTGAPAGRGARGLEGSRKRRRDEDDGIKKPDLKLTIPDVLKAMLVDDWEVVTKENRIAELPRDPNVREILDEFKQFIINRPVPLSQTSAVISTLISGLRTYFDRSLGSILLYRYERAQYADIRKKYITGQHVNATNSRTMSEVYGFEHLCRLLVKLPEMVSHTTMDDASVSLLREYVNELMKWMVQEKDRLFNPVYETPSSHYHNLARV